MTGRGVIVLAIVSVFISVGLGFGGLWFADVFHPNMHVGTIIGASK